MIKESRVWASLVAQRVKNLPAMQETGVWSLGQEAPLEKEWQPTPVFLPGETQGQRSLVGYSPWSCKRAGHDLVTKQQQHLPSFCIFKLQWWQRCFYSDVNRWGLCYITWEPSWLNMGWGSFGCCMQTCPYFMFGWQKPTIYKQFHTLEVIF